MRSFHFFNFIIDFILCCFYECCYIIVIVNRNSSFVCWFSEYVIFSKENLVFGFFKMGFEFNTSVKIFQFFVKRGSIDLFFGLEQSFTFLFNSLKVSFVNHFLLKLITCAAGSDGSPVLLSIVLCSLTKFLWLVLWSWRRQLVGYFLVDLGETQRLCSHFFDYEFMLLLYISVLVLCHSFLDCFSNLFLF